QALQSDMPFSRIPSADENGHGTFLAGIAAGGENQAQNFMGAAPGANLIIIRLKPAKKYLRELFVIPEGPDIYQENDIMLAVRYALERSQRLFNIPLSICIGLGNGTGSHFGTSPLSQYLNEAGRKFRTSICIAAGNEGNARHHYQGITLPRNAPDIAELRVAEGESGFTMELWGTSLTPYDITLQSPSGESARITPSRFDSAQTIRFIFTKSVIYITTFPLESQSGNQVVVFRFLLPEPGIWRFLISTNSRTELFYNMWLPVRGLIKDDTYFLRASPYETITSPGDSDAPITVTAYDYRNDSLYLESSRGFSPSQLIKPELSAPGVDIKGPLPGGRFTIRSGSSIAAAHTAGAVSLFLEWAVTQKNSPAINGLGVKNASIRSARREAAEDYPNREFGYGFLDLYNTFSSLF
ncbi:MAG: S8 family peptidase, partial [Clostridium sp.]|nr:S8 family peptidase [Clostridium sp.]